MTSIPSYESQSLICSTKREEKREKKKVKQKILFVIRIKISHTRLWKHIYFQIKFLRKPIHMELRIRGKWSQSTFFAGSVCVTFLFSSRKTSTCARVNVIPYCYSLHRIILKYTQASKCITCKCEYQRNIQRNFFGFKKFFFSFLEIIPKKNEMFVHDLP